VLRRPLLYINVSALRPGTLGGYGLAFLSVGVATLLRLAVDPFVIGVPFVTFWPAVIITALISGFGAGLFCVALSAAAAAFFVLSPHQAFYIQYRADVADLLLFVSLACFSVIVIAEMRDAIEREQAERVLRESKERLQLALDAARLGWWQYDPRRLVASGDARFKEIFDVTADELHVEEIRKLVHPDDAEKFWRNHSAKLDPTGPQRSTHEYRVQRRDGGVRWVRVCWLAYHEGAGRERRVASVVGTVQDITEHKECAEREYLLKERLQLALDAARLGWWQYDPLHRVVLGDARFKEIFGVVEDESAIEEAMRWVYLDDAERVGAAREAALDPGDPKPLAIEHRIQRGDGEVRWVEARGLAYFEGAGRERKAVRLVGTVADITERRENAEKAHLLTREINHRAKNILSVVDAIAQRIAASNPQNFARRFSERIQALSANQDLLIRNEWKGVGIEDLVRAQLAHFADLIGSRIAIQGPKLLLRGASAQAIGLALHELATNAGKYGALSTDSGRVDIRWSCDSGTLTMSWTERDGPPVSVPERCGFGTIVMKAMAERSLDGTVGLDYAPSGVMWRLTCPAANALSAGNDQGGEGRRRL
jgi:two-component system, chemotaxis family, CheB/CheR fusion protein